MMTAANKNVSLLEALRQMGADKDADFLRDGARLLAQRLIELEAMNMLTQQTIEALRSLRLPAMAQAYAEQTADPQAANLSFDERLGIIVDREIVARENKRLTRLIREAALRLNVCIEDIDYTHARGLDRSAMPGLRTCRWIEERLNVVVTGPTGVGKMIIACALAHSACRHGFSARYYRVPCLLSELTVAHGDGSYPKLLSRLSRTRLLILDDWGTAPPGPSESRDILEIIDDRSQLSSTIIAGQLPVEDRHASRYTIACQHDRQWQ